MAIDNSITFGGINSADFGIYISGEGVFDAPKRDVEMVSIPGRNGEFALDKGRFENIEVTYPAFNYEEDLATFAEKLSDFRNALASQAGYQRLTDTLHPDEYRMATFVDGLEIKPIKYNTASQFDIVFNCKPQRYLTSGETAISVNSGDTVTNPTRFAAGPLLEVEGYGDIQFNGFEIKIEDGTLGELTLSNGGTGDTFEINTDLCNTGDSLFVIAGSKYTFRGGVIPAVSSVSITPAAGNDGTVTYAIIPKSGTFGQYYELYCEFGQMDFVVGTDDEKEISFDYVIRNSGSETYTGTAWVKYTYDATTSKIAVTAGGFPSGSGVIPTITKSTKEIKAISTIDRLGNPTYIDCDLGNAYKFESGEIVSLNQLIDLGSELPELSPGANVVTFDNTITDLQIVPNWWKI